ncbi:hypothetical protein HN51_065464 [Arachis hypogaea]|uniref:Pectinesterase inhibitor domain-containing protein n=1 Tax=Arachis hypogaea TaxID=3818 RepID=A0A444ZEP3_ARAHY|nr:cell wall / vacuolar inhibitor of fructosidase 1-like [Arachis ipaensis]XP_025646444.1 cell wall / vacuolar inhibitor of fructosidase 1 [Arachis hypogaea]QHO06611.1 Cell wall / vacuolar inhibitor of fructosidase [Arachis hypogaea]RYR12642.1 hypothetical protein Ahy_B04g070085 [Arachis hypogaea]
MAKTLHITFTITIILLFSSSSIPCTQSQTTRVYYYWNENNGVEDLIEQVCKRTPFYDLCISTLHNNPLLSPKSDIKQVALIMVNNILSNATDTLNYIEALLKHTKDPQLEQALALCAESYIPVVRFTLPQAAVAISQGHFAFASYCISDAVKEVNSCEGRLVKSPSDKSPLGDRNDVVQKLVDVANAIIKLLLKA